jgi:hypothetical protein
MTRKAKSMVELMKEFRNTWHINPRTRVQENELKNKKKRRAEGKRLSKSDW